MLNISMNRKIKGIRLTIIKDRLRGEVFEFDRSPVRIGRKEGELLLKDPKVSGKHAELKWSEEDGAIIRDAGSRNGTFLNGKKVSCAPLHEDDRLLMGETECIFSYIALREENLSFAERAARLAREWDKLRCSGSTERKIEELLVNEIKELRQSQPKD